MKNILIIRLSSVGDVINALPTAEALKTKYNNAKIFWLVSPPCHEILKLTPSVDELIIWDRRPFDAAVKNKNFILAIKLLLEAKKLLSKYEFDALIDIHSLFLTGVLAKFTKAKLKIGIDELHEGNSFFMDETVKLSDEIHKAKRYFTALSALKFDDRLPKPSIFSDNKLVENARKILIDNNIDISKKLLAINLKTTWDNKHYPMEMFVKVIENIKEDVEIIYTGVESDKSVIEDVRLKANRGVSIAGKTNIIELFAIFKIVNLLLTIDSGPMHIASLAGLKTVSLWGPTSPKMYAPLFGDNRFIISPCHCVACNKRKCKLGDNLCMRAINPTEVANVVNELLFKIKV